MKKLFLVIAALIPSIIFQSCIYLGPPVRGNGNVIEETRKVGDFSQIRTSKGTNIYISQGTAEKVVIKADENLIDVIETRVHEGVLNITLNQPIRKATSNKVFVTVKDLNKITAFAGSNVYSDTTLKFDDIVIRSSAGSNIKLEVAAQSLDISASAGANIFISGMAGKLKTSASAGSNVKAEGLEVKDCEARVNSGANVYISVTGDLDAKASSGGNIFYSGNPKSININSSSGGNVKKR